MIVVDTSALVEFLLVGDGNASALPTAIDAEVFAATHGVGLECMAVLRGLVKGGRLPESEAVRVLELLARMHIRSCDHMPLATRIWNYIPGIRCPLYVATG